jgi:hypothetical protein
MSVSVKWTVDPVQSLAGLATGIRNKAMRIAINAGAAPMKAAVIAQAPSDSGLLKKAIRIRVRNYKANNTWAAIIGASTAFKRNVKIGRGRNAKRKLVRPAKYQPLVDRGTKNFAGRNFMAAALNSAKAAFAQATLRKLSEVIPQLISGQKP